MNMLLKNGNCKRKRRVQKLANFTLRDLAAKLDVHFSLYAFIFKFIAYFSFT